MCSALGVGGVTPSAGLIKHCVQHLDIPVHVLVRPRAGDFLYDTNEMAIILDDIAMCRDLGAKAVVVGFLKADGSIDETQLQMAIRAAEGMKVVFHRAFDMCKAPMQAIEVLQQHAVDYVLSSGQQATAVEGAALLKEMHDACKGTPLKIMAGAGVRVHNIAQLAAHTHADAFHMSARMLTDGGMQYRKTDVGMGADSLDKEYSIQTHDTEAICKAKALLSEDKNFTDTK
ncbi:MAG: copper homeostasis protein CutC [Gammaproteobacteria bacterium]|nr:MAG: copper homeostasis protein CutC [Gammaproteobacteria bacterium]